MKAFAGGRPAPPERSGSAFVCGDLEIDVGRQRVRQAGRDIDLPRLSFDLLLAIVRVAPNVINIETLTERVWAGIIVNPETVVQRISLLRESLGDDSQEPRYIGSLRGRGYFLIPPVANESALVQLVPVALPPDPTPQPASQTEDPRPDSAPSSAKPVVALVAGACALLALLVWLISLTLDKWTGPDNEGPVAAVPAIDPETVARTVAVMRG